MTKVSARVLQSVIRCGDQPPRSRHTGFCSLDEPLTAGELAVLFRYYAPPTEA
jgi:hypothetical protein